MNSVIEWLDTVGPDGAPHWFWALLVATAPFALYFGARLGVKLANALIKSQQFEAILFDYPGIPPKPTTDCPKAAGGYMESAKRPQVIADVEDLKADVAALRSQMFASFEGVAKEAVAHEARLAKLEAGKAVPPVDVPGSAVVIDHQSQTSVQRSDQMRCDIWRVQQETTWRVDGRSKVVHDPEPGVLIDGWRWRAFRRVADGCIRLHRCGKSAAWRNDAGDWREVAGMLDIAWYAKVDEPYTELPPNEVAALVEEWRARR